MASISTTLQLTDRITAPLNNMISALQRTESGFESIENAMDTAFDVAEINGSIRAVEQLESVTNRVGREITDNTSRQSRFNSSLSSGNGMMNKMLSTMTAMASTYLSMQGVKMLIGMSDTMSSNTARLDNMNGNWGESNYSTEGLEKLIFEQAQNAGAAYQSMVEQVARFGNNATDAFGSAEEVVYFTDLLNKQLVNDGAFAQTAEGAITQLAQALGSGVLMGDEMVTLLEATPGLIQNIADYMGVAFGEVKGLASDGQVTADIVKSAMFVAADDINAKFETMPNTWSRVWTRMQNQATVALEPVLDKLSEIANSERFQNFTMNLANGMAVVGNVLVSALDLVVGFGNHVAENWSDILPTVLGVAGGFVAIATAMKIATAAQVAFRTGQAVVNGLLLAQNVIMGAFNAISTAVVFAKMSITAMSGLMAGGMTLSALATNTLTASMRTLWATLAPLVIGFIKIILVIMVIAAVIGFVIYKIIEWGDTTTTVVGNICGVLAVAGAFVWNLILGLVNFIIGLFVSLWNLIATFANFFGNVFNNPVQAIVTLFSNLFDFILSVVQSAAKAIDTLLGSNMAGAISGFRDNVKEFTVGLVGEQEVIVDYINADDYTFDGIDYRTAWDSGVAFGEGLEDGIGNLFNTDDLFGGDDPIDYSQFGGFDTDSLSGDISDISSNTGSIADTLSVSEEDLKYLRDMAEREAINRFTTAEVTVNMGGVTNNVDNKMDLDGFVSYLATSVEEAMQTTAEGVHV